MFDLRQAFDESFQSSRASTHSVCFSQRGEIACSFSNSNPPEQQCPYCFKMFKSLSSLAGHVARHKKEGSRVNRRVSGNPLSEMSHAIPDRYSDEQSRCSQQSSGSSQGEFVERPNVCFTHRRTENLGFPTHRAYPREPTSSKTYHESVYPSSSECQMPSYMQRQAFPSQSRRVVGDPHETHKRCRHPTDSRVTLNWQNADTSDHTAPRIMPFQASHRTITQHPSQTSRRTGKSSEMHLQLLKLIHCISV